MPRVSAHELGHALGLPHRQNRTNLMASGTTGTLLNQAEVAITRARAAKVAGALTVPQAKEAIETAKTKGDTSLAGSLQKELNALAQ